MNFQIKSFEALEPDDTIIIPGDPNCKNLLFREEQEWTVEKKHDDQTVKVKELGGVVVKMNLYKVKIP